MSHWSVPAPAAAGPTSASTSIGCCCFCWGCSRASARPPSVESWSSSEGQGERSDEAVEKPGDRVDAGGGAVDASDMWSSAAVVLTDEASTFLGSLR